MVRPSGLEVVRVHRVQKGSELLHLGLSGWCIGRIYAFITGRWNKASLIDYLLGNEHQLGVVAGSLGLWDDRAAEERELQERRRVLEAQEAAEHERMIREMQDLETAQAASLVTAERDAREAQAAERKEIERVVREAEEAEAAAADAEHRAKEEERRRRDQIMAAANAKLKAAKAAEATSIAAAKAAAEAAKIAEEMAREAAEAQALANGDEDPSGRLRQYAAGCLINVRQIQAAHTQPSG